MAKESPVRNKLVARVTTPTVLAGITCGLIVSLMGKKDVMGYVTNIVGFGIAGCVGGIVLGNVVVNKKGV